MMRSTVTQMNSQDVAGPSTHINWPLLQVLLCRLIWREHAPVHTNTARRFSSSSDVGSRHLFLAVTVVATVTVTRLTLRSNSEVVRVNRRYLLLPATVVVAVLMWTQSGHRRSCRKNCRRSGCCRWSLRSRRRL